MITYTIISYYIVGIEGLFYVIKRGYYTKESEEVVCDVVGGIGE